MELLALIWASSSSDDEDDDGGLDDGTCLRREERADGLYEDGGHTVAEGGVFLLDLEEDFVRRLLSRWDLDGVTSRW